MTFPPLHQPQRDETDDLSSALVESLTRQVKREAQQALHGRAGRLQQVAAEFAHLGAVADELLALALDDVKRAPDYFASLTRLGLSQTLSEGRAEEQTDVVEGKARKKQMQEADDHEQP